MPEIIKLVNLVSESISHGWSYFTHHVKTGGHSEVICDMAEGMNGLLGQ